MQKDLPSPQPVKLSAMDEDILTVLLGRKLYGLEILDQLNLDRPIELKHGSLYPAMNRLEEKGLVSWQWGDEADESGGGRRKYYEVTELGAKSLSEVQQYRVGQAKSTAKALCKKAAEELGFQSLAELARNAGVSESTISRVIAGAKLTDNTAQKIIEAIKSQNYSQGWDALESAGRLVYVLNYLRNHLAHLRGREALHKFREEDAERWDKNYTKISHKSQYNLIERIDLIPISSNLKKQLELIQEFCKAWKIKHDFCYSKKISSILKQNLDLIVSSIRLAAKKGFYVEVKETFTQIRHIAHLCDEFEFVADISKWLIEHSFNHGDMPTYIKAKTTLAWTLSSNREAEPLREAQELTDRVWELLENPEISKKITSEDMDVVAIICELRLRIPTRLQMYKHQSLAINNFNNLHRHSLLMLNKFQKNIALDTRLKMRYQIPLQYQHGIYLYTIEKYEEAKNEFQNVLYNSNLIGWDRVEQGSATWLATLTKKMNDIDSCRKYLEKIDEKPFLKLRKISNKIKNEISSNY
ncbi:helix-turn-helix transcriptional regulator [Oscillatoriales cyanobacterium LEGE 11467]|uniref:Helix-turn-helix transcriptional regulator n=1 Tax=Zarconia navalis LEGE 11467 TaxID=1828826 RepID=A0A928VSB8_9CYAN|nr:helix-turn-helix transcriptional regulator [Zarconia navalis]MBE9039372.1 helix-turn-helix transcriptional regulator [Zarconia navalis LEGE 11467]